MGLASYEFRNEIVKKCFALHHELDICAMSDCCWV